MSPAAVLGGSLEAVGIIVVSDAGPLISLARLDLLAVLPQLFAQVQVPTEVLAECLARPGNMDAGRILDACTLGLLQTCSAPTMTLDGLGAGECAAISRALEIGAAVLMDDSAARARAAELGLLVTGTLGVLVRARRRGLVGPLLPLIDALRAGGQRLSQPVVELILRDAGEASA